MNRFYALSLSLHHQKLKILSPLCVSYMLGRGISKPIREVFRVSSNEFRTPHFSVFPILFLFLPSLFYVRIQTPTISAKFVTDVLLQVQMSCMNMRTGNFTSRSP